MSRKRTKQYLMLLMVVGLVSIAAGGGGTFASFSAETTNAGNYFATGSLVLNDNGGTNTCTSAINSNNATPADSNNLNDTGTDCDTLFKLNQFTQPTASVASLTAVATTVTYTGLTAPIYKGDSVTIKDSNGSQNVVAATSSTTATGAGSFTITVATGNAYTSATITDNNPTYMANLTLTNAGSINANGIKFEAGGTPCSSKYTEGHGTLNTTVANIGDASGSSLAVTGAGITAGSFKAGDPVVVTESGHAQTFIASGNSTTNSIPINGDNWNYTYDTSAIVSGPEFNGPTAQSLCDDLTFSMVETTSAFAQNMAGALGCAYDPTNTTPVATNSCDLANSTALSGLPTTLTPLSINTTGGGGDNTANLLNAGKSRYFLIAVHYIGGAFDNTYQNTSAANLDLTWHIDQV